MSQEVEPSIVDYARFYGLIRDHLENHPLKDLTAPDDFWSELKDNHDLFQIRQDSVKVPVERLTIDASAASLLASVAALGETAPRPDDADEEFDTHRVRQLKLELPLLRSDPEVDQLRFAPSIVPDLEHELLPLETVDQEADEGFDWPARYYELPDEYSRKLKTEKLEVNSDALAFLKDSLSLHHEDGGHGVFEDVEPPHTRKTKVQPVSPPLLPMSPVPLPFVPSSDTGLLELLSDHSSPTRDEIREAERVIFDKDTILPANKGPYSSSQNSDPMLLDAQSLGNIYSPLKGVGDPPTSPPSPRRGLDTHKVEVPLSPMISDQSPPWKRKGVSFSEVLTEVIQDLPPTVPRPENVSSDDIDAFFDEVVRPIGIQAERSIEQEKLQEADTTLRVPVPVMDFSLPSAPWATSHQRTKTTDGDLYKDTLIEMKKLQFSKDIWPLRGKLERELTWTPFPAALGKFAVQDSIADDDLINDYLAPPDRVDIETLTWKPDGLRILDELAESEDELEEGVFLEERDLFSLVRKRKYALEEEEEEEDSPRASDHENVGATPIDQSKGKPGARSFDSPIALNDSFSALNALDSYMNVRTGQIEKPKTTADHHFQKAVKTSMQTDTPKADIPISTVPPTQKTISIPSPQITIPTSPIPFVVSVSFLSNRKLSRQIQRLFPSAEFIERDFNLYLDPPERPPSKAPAVPTNKSTMADEADMILSPSTGLIWTTLQKTKQRSLPGQIARSAVRDRIARTAPRYERLVILVSEDRPIGTSLNNLDNTGNNPDESDCQALIDLIAFSSNLESEIQVLFIPGDSENLTKWIVATMVKHGITDPDLKLIQDETMWEIFLRRAGINAFAAQAVLANLKAPTDRGNVDVTEYGLTAFTKMSMEERFTRFETLLGGRRVLERVSRMLDARW